MTAWPWPADTITDRARRVAQSYREALTRTAPAEAAALDGRFAEYGEGWVAPELVTVDPDEWVTLEVAAEHTSVGPDAIRKWVTRDRRLPGHTGTDGRLRVQLGAVLDVQADLRRARAARRS